MTKTGCIYTIRNVITKKYYVGQTTKPNPLSRWKQHLGNCRRGKVTRLYNSIRKYGESCFEFEVIVSNVPVELLDSLETNCITAYDGVTNGYNILSEGSTMRGYKFSEETLSHLSSVRKGKVPVNKGIKCPEFSGINHPRARAVTCVETGKTYVTAKAAADDLQLSHSSVVAVARGRLFSTKGYTFHYAGEKPVTVVRKPINNSKKVICINTSKSYASMVEAARDNGITYRSVKKVCTGVHANVHGLIFKFI